MEFPLEMNVRSRVGGSETGDLRLEIGVVERISISSPARSQIELSARASPTVNADEWMICSPPLAFIVNGTARRIWIVIGKDVIGSSNLA